MQANTSLQHARIVSSSFGRLRAHIPSLYRSHQEQQRIEMAFSNRRHILAVYANPLTARVLILFDPAVTVSDMVIELGFSLPSEKKEEKNTSAALVNRPARQSAARELNGTKASAKPSRTANEPQGPDYFPWHMREASAALAFHDSSLQLGLTTAAATNRLRQGLNALPHYRMRSAIETLLDQFKSLPVVMLGVSALLSLLTGGVAEAMAIMSVLGLNGGIGFVTERRAESTIATLSELIDDHVPVLRDSYLQNVETTHIAPGDILVLLPGVHIAADARLVKLEGLTVDESALTGESMPVTKSAARLEQATALGDRLNMVYRGTSVVSGTGLAVVVGTGGNTEIGAIQALMMTSEHPQTPLQKQLDQLGNRLVKVSGGICIGVFFIGLLRDYGVLPMLKASISLAIAAVPEGLPAVATTSLARGIRILRLQNVLIRQLQAVETLGAIQIICLDKTGTLTMNQMSATAVHSGNRHYEVQAGRLSLQGQQIELSTHSAHPDLARLLHICILCSQAGLDEDNGNASGSSPTENALIKLAVEAGMSVSEVRQSYPMLAMALRGEGRNYMQTIHQIEGGGGYLVAVKGSPTEVLGRCMHYQCGQQLAPLDHAVRAAMASENEEMAQRGMRVLGFAYAELAANPANGGAAPELIWAGLVGMADPLRPGVAQVIENFHRAGIRTVMLTGDQSATAHAIGKSLGLSQGPDLHVLNAERIEQLPPDVLAAHAGKADIFARVSPVNKLNIVQALQKEGGIVAMTGDGINDGPALQVADVGIAMGHGGTDLARSAADVVLMDDRLETLLDAASIGRTISTNIRKSLHFLISSNLSEILVVVGALSAGAGQPLSPMQLLWLNLLSDVWPAIALAAEPPEPDVMLQKPRDPAKPFIGADELKLYAREGGLLAGGALAAYFFGIARHGQGARAGTIGFNALILGQLLHALSCRDDQSGIFNSRKKNGGRQLEVAIAVSAGLQVLANVLPCLRTFLGIERMGLTDIVASLSGALIPLALNEGAKRPRRSL